MASDRTFFEHEDTKSRSRNRRRQNIAEGKYRAATIAEGNYRRRQISRRQISRSKYHEGKYREASIAAGINIVYPPKTL